LIIDKFWSTIPTNSGGEKVSEFLEQHLYMFTTSLGNKTFSDQDLTDLFNLLLEQTSAEQADEILQAVKMFFDTKPALYADIVREKLSKDRDSAIALLLRQLDDPEVDSEAIGRSIKHMGREVKKKGRDYLLNCLLLFPLLFDLRREELVESMLERLLDLGDTQDPP